MTAQLLRKALFGGVFGRDQYELATQPIVSGGLHAVRFMVIELRAGRIVSMADTKPEALAGARKVLTCLGRAVNEPLWRQQQLWAEAGPAAVAQSNAADTPRRVSRRRREVFNRSEGRCHYCCTPLTLDGTWHIEHQLPRALGGTDEPLNLVAACEPCNLSKSDQTALEFMVKRRA